MRVSTRMMRFATLLAIAASVLGVAASSAFATKNIEPLNTKFAGKLVPGTEVSWEGGGGIFSCRQSTLTGTTNSTKTKFVNATDSFSECESGAYVFKFADQCAVKGTVPWTLTFNEPEGGTVKLNCALTIKLAEVCTVTIPQQTVSSFFWSNLAGPSLEWHGVGVKFTSLEHNAGCAAIEWTPTSLTMEGRWNLPGIHFV
jgi:hypothetical protein